MIRKDNGRLSYGEVRWESELREGALKEAGETPWEGDSSRREGEEKGCACGKGGQTREPPGTVPSWCNLLWEDGEQRGEALLVSTEVKTKLMERVSRFHHLQTAEPHKTQNARLVLQAACTVEKKMAHGLHRRGSISGSAIGQLRVPGQSA